MTTNEKPYIHVLRYLFEKGDEKEINDYILGFSENDDDYDIFVQKIQELCKDGDFKIIEQMIYDEDLIPHSSGDDFDFEDDQELENFLYGDENQKDELMDRIPEDKEDELSMENLEKEVGEESKEILEDIGEQFGIKDLSK